jgi:hypothetical protein
MKPGDHPDFYRLAPPPGTSRESTIRIDRDGKFWHDGQRVDHPALERALASWIARHPDDGRVILTNGYDWCYVRVDDAPFVVRGVRVEAPSGPADRATLLLSDDSEEPLDPRQLSLDDEGVVYASVKQGAFDARFSRHAQTELAPLLSSADPPTIALGSREVVLPRRTIQ